MTAPPILQEIWRARTERWGQEDTGYTFDGNGGPQPLDRIDVFVYRASPQLQVTSFATIGMAARAMPGGSRAELHCAVQGEVSPEEESAIAVQLANLACFPWQPGVQRDLDWHQTLDLGGDFAGTFPDLTAAYLSPPWSDGGWAWIQAGSENVKVLNVIPVKQGMRQEAASMPGPIFLEALKSTPYSEFAPRP